MTAQRGVMIRKAKIADVETILSLINSYAKGGEMLPRSREEVYEAIREFTVCEGEDGVVGVVALHVYASDLAEIRSLAVAEACGMQGIGTALTKRCLNESGELGIARVFVLTDKSAFFERLGFKRIDKQHFPQKVWTDCLKCEKYMACNEMALICELNGTCWK